MFVMKNIHRMLTVRKRNEKFQNETTTISIFINTLFTNEKFNPELNIFKNEGVQ